MKATITSNLPCPIHSAPDYFSPFVRMAVKGEVFEVFPLPQYNGWDRAMKFYEIIAGPDTGHWLYGGVDAQITLEGVTVTPNPVNYVVVVHLIPQDTTDNEYNIVTLAARPGKQSVVYSADDAKRLVQPGLAGSKVILWEEGRFPAGIAAFLGTTVELRYFKTPNPVPLPSAAFRGLQMRADGGSTDADFACLAKLNGAKLMTNTGFDELDRLTALVPARNIILRLYASGNNPSLGNAEQFYSEQSAWLAYFQSKGGVYVEVHNEMNLPQEGLGVFWKTPAEWGQFYKSVRDKISLWFPALKAAWGGLSPQPNVPDWLDALKVHIANGWADWIAAHCYWSNSAGMESASDGRGYRQYLNMGRPVIVTEFSNNKPYDSDAVKGQQYKRYWASLEAGVLGATAFISSASDPDFDESRQTWVRNGILTDIPRQL